tara:strand:- start:22 stop:348 length:327 start_codon:yes stop_codon:yes gene_type:complete
MEPGAQGPCPSQLPQLFQLHELLHVRSCAPQFPQPWLSCVPGVQVPSPLQLFQSHLSLQVDVPQLPQFFVLPGVHCFCPLQLPQSLHWHWSVQVLSLVPQFPHAVDVC